MRTSALALEGNGNRYSQHIAHFTFRLTHRNSAITARGRLEAARALARPSFSESHSTVLRFFQFGRTIVSFLHAIYSMPLCGVQQVCM